MFFVLIRTMLRKFIHLAFNLLLLLVVKAGFSQSISFSPVNLTFTNPILTTSADSAVVNLTNNSCGFIHVFYIYSPISEFKISDTSGFWIAPSTSKSFRVKFKPRHNIQYNSTVLMHTNVGDFSFPVAGYGKYVEAYYDNTYNKFDEALKTSLNTILGTNFLSFSYNAARDKMFMEIDNKKVNGQGATQNTLECIYTGRLAVGYIARTDCQTNSSFNTEHTWPQSLFSSSSPMVSDLNHLFPTDDAANNYRSNNAFGIVSSPSWSNGGSKGISTLFEPRDAQKGRSARAMLYFAIRYNNPAYGLVTFFGPQESILRTWCMQFLPDTIDRKRNEDIFAYQKNRNPFIDHPEFLERITSIANTSVAPSKSLLWCDAQQINNAAYVYDSINYKVIVYNNGNTDIACSQIKCSQSQFALNAASANFSRQAVLEISLRKLLNATGNIIDTLIIENNSTNQPTLKIPISINVNAIKIIPNKTSILATNDSAILTIASNGTVSWNTGGTGKSLVVRTAGIYFAYITDSTGCHHTDTVTIILGGNGIKNSALKGFSASPNPCRDFITVISGSSEIEHFVFVNSLGQKLASFDTNPTEKTQLEVLNYPSGIYYLQSANGKGVRIVIRN